MVFARKPIFAHVNDCARSATKDLRICCDRLMTHQKINVFELKHVMICRRKMELFIFFRIWHVWHHAPITKIDAFRKFGDIRNGASKCNDGNELICYNRCDIKEMNMLWQLQLIRFLLLHQLKKRLRLLKSLMFDCSRRWRKQGCFGQK